MLLAYAIHRKTPVFILGQITGAIVYARNLMLIYERRKKDKLEQEQADTIGPSAN